MRLNSIIAVVAFSAAASPVQGAVVGWCEVGGEFVHLEEFSQLDRLSFGLVTGFSQGSQIWLEENVSLTTGDIGTTFIYTGSAVDAIRNQFADADQSDRLGWGFDPAGLDGWPTYLNLWTENEFDTIPHQYGNMPNSQDLAATGFDTIRVTVLDYVPPVFEYIPDFDQELTHFTLWLRYDFVTSVPAPGALCMLCAGGLVRRRRSRA